MSAAAFTIFWMKVDNNILLNVVILNFLHSDGKYLTKNEHEVVKVVICAILISGTVELTFCGVNLCSQVKLEWHSLVFCSLGAIAGMIFGLEVLFKNYSRTTLKSYGISFLIGKEI